jgi:hypothetical protein
MLVRHRLLSIESLVPAPAREQICGMDLAFLLPWVLGTAALSAVFGMAGGMVLLLALTSRMPLAEAMVLHGALQLVSNGSRAVFSAAHVRLDIVGRFGAAGVLAALLLGSLAIGMPAVAALAVDLRLVLIATGVLACAEPLLGLLGNRSLRLPQIDTHFGGYFAGGLICALHLSSGATGPLLDALCVNSALGRHENVATKAAVQSIGHLLKMIYFGALGAATATLASDGLFTPAALPRFALLALASVGGTWLGRKVLDRMTDSGFRSATRAIVCAIGVISLARGLLL